MFHIRKTFVNSLEFLTISKILLILSMFFWVINLHFYGQIFDFFHAISNELSSLMADDCIV